MNNQNDFAASILYPDQIFKKRKENIKYILFDCFNETRKRAKTFHTVVIRNQNIPLTIRSFLYCFLQELDNLYCYHFLFLEKPSATYFCHNYEPILVIWS